MDVEEQLMCAHYDTKVDTPGASDNAGGASVLLALAQLLSQREHVLGLEWSAFSGLVADIVESLQDKPPDWTR